MTDRKFERMPEPSFRLDDFLLHVDVEFADQVQSTTVGKMFDGESGLIPLPEAIQALKINPQVIDIGCGIGSFTRALARRFDRRAEVIGYDPERKYIARARRISGKEYGNLSFDVGGDMNNLDSTFLDDKGEPRKVGMITATSVLHMTDDLEGVMKGFYEGLDSDGMLVFYDVDHNDPEVTEEMVRMRKQEGGDQKLLRDLGVRRTGKINPEIQGPVSKLFSSMAAYTRGELETALQTAGFQRYNVAQGPGMVIGYGIKSRF